ncbi:MAG TPA: ABC transporter ATP-binding protein [Solirubrobacteraceae bacterium]|nr:ABC transporter ATP-binding protein [Solirubrobacteraceae bacterium]
MSDPAAGAAACEARGLTKRFGDRVALDSVSFTLGSGELVGLVGANGAGKTTLLSVLAGVLAPDTGTLSISGSVGWVPQSVAVYSRLTVAENLRLFARLERVDDAESAVARMLQQTRLSDRARDQAGRLSGGNRQRLNIALGLLADPAVLLLDEPTAALDPDQRERMWEFIGALAARETTVLFSSHELSEVERRAGRVLALQDGRLVGG